MQAMAKKKSADNSPFVMPVMPLRRFALAFAAWRVIRIDGVDFCMQ
jgi:hypothetical protein